MSTHHQLTGPARRRQPCPRLPLLALTALTLGPLAAGAQTPESVAGLTKNLTSPHAAARAAAVAQLTEEALAARGPGRILTDPGALAASFRQAGAAVAPLTRD